MEVSDLAESGDKKGEHVIFTGLSGCGKSTVLKLLLCLYPLGSGKRYLLTRQGEQPLTSAWRGLFAYVPQENQRLSGTIREVIAFGNSDKMQQEKQLFNFPSRYFPIKPV